MSTTASNPDRFRRPSSASSTSPNSSTCESKDKFTAIEDIDIDLADGEFLVLVGPSGCGKSTLLDLLGGLSTPTSGRILLDGQPVTGPGLDRGIVFQQYALLPWRTARHNIEFGLEAKGLPKKERRELAEHYLELVGLKASATGTRTSCRAA